MKGIRGNTKATFQISAIEHNAIGEAVKQWTDVQTLTGWLDLASGDSHYTAYSAKVQESTHLFLADYVPLDERIKPETARMVIGGSVYDVTLIDDPMGLHIHFEIYLKYTGGR